MKETTKNIKLSQRLQQIQAQIDRPYTHIWDCCCDHGLLGLSLLERQLAQCVHFVDVVPDLLTQLAQTLEKHWQGSKLSWQVHCIDAGKLPLAQYTQGQQQDTHLIIIAGIGGELMIELLKSLCPLTADYQVEFILCPVHHNYKVRQFLIAKRLQLLNESLVFENKRGYEVLHVSRTATTRLTATGASMWQLNNPDHQAYLHNTIAHYQRIAKNPDSDVSEIINAYQALLPD